MTLTAMQLNQELQKQISIIADDDKGAKLEKILSMTSMAPLSDEEIVEEAEKGREEFYAQRK